MGAKFINLSPKGQHLIDELAKFVAGQAETGFVEGIPVKREADGSASMPLAMDVKIWPIQIDPRDQKLKQRLIIDLPLYSESFPWISRLVGVRGPSKNAGFDHISLYVRDDVDDQEGAADEESQQEGGQY